MKIICRECGKKIKLGEEPCWKLESLNSESLGEESFVHSKCLEMNYKHLNKSVKGN